MNEEQVKIAQQVWGALKTNKFSDESAAGILGNVQAESSFNNNVVQIGGGAFGLFQFDPNGALPGYKKWCKSKGLDIKSVGAQTNYMITQLSGSFNSYTGKTYRYPNGTVTWWPTKMSLDEFKKKKGGASGAATCAEIFCRVYERPSIPHMDNRKKYAKDWYSKFKGTNGTDESSSISLDFNKTTEKLYSSDNFDYIKQEEKEEDSYDTLSKSLASQFKEAFNGIKNVNTKNAQIEKLVIPKSNGEVNPRKESTFAGAVRGSSLPIVNTFVEAPFIEVTLGSETFGTLQTRRGYKSYPNYVQALNVERVNATLNNYTIQLIHQISPGDNPNYIASLLSNVGFNKISLRYGDGATASFFSDTEALITNVQSSFNIVSNLITYTITATSLPYALNGVKYNFPKKEDKPSNVILEIADKMKQLWTVTSSNLADNPVGKLDKAIFETYKNLPSTAVELYKKGVTIEEQVISNGIKAIDNVPQLVFNIANNDKKTVINAVKDKTYLEYLSYLVSLMKNENSELENKSSYYLSIDNVANNLSEIAFVVKEISSVAVTGNALVYDVDLGYPDSSMPFIFTVNTNYAWAAAYESSLPISDYRYDITNYGDLIKQKSLSIYDNTLDNSNYTIQTNEWKQLTRFPITATLTIKGLLQPIMLLTYVNIHNYYFGSKRITSGTYIVTSQTDSVNAQGYRTTLGLTRVASDDESISVDGRVRT